jgi:ketosteroid isomerase-like protein
MLSRNEIEKTLVKWYQSWNEHNFNDVMQLFHEEVVFENWTGRKIKGKKTLRRAWEPWFRDHEEFRFIEKETFIDEIQQKALFRWLLEWASKEKGFEGLWEKREGVDVLHFKDRKIIQKLTYSKTPVEIGRELIALSTIKQ